ncbi:MAG: aspartyl protease family protein [Chthoniobacterales bacterium]
MRAFLAGSIALLVCGSSVSSIAATPPIGSRSRALSFETLSLERSGQNHLLLRAQINGKPALLGVDTGAPMSLIAASRLQYFGVSPVRPSPEIPPQVQINGRFNNVMTARSLQLGRLNLVDEPMVAIDLESTAQAARAMKEQAIDGIIGTDILFPTNAILDCRAQRLILKMDPAVRGGVIGMDYRGFIRVPIHVSDGLSLYVDARFNGKRAKLRIDTGAFSTLLHQSFVRTMKIPLRKTMIVSAPVNLKQRGLQVATISRFFIGSVDMQSKEVGVTDLAGIIGDAVDTTTPDAGLLGAEILRRHNAIIDFGTRTLYLKR